MKYYVISTSNTGDGAVFTNQAEARKYHQENPGSTYSEFNTLPNRIPPMKSTPEKPISECNNTGLDSQSEIIVYTDGSCIGNPGPGGYGAVIVADGISSELSGGFSHTTNNRMEMMAVISALESVKGTPDQQIKVFSDSEYTLNGITKGWAKKWRLKGWKKPDGKPALNPDLWERLLNLTDKFSDLSFEWVRGHAGNPLNERADQLAASASNCNNLITDHF